MSRRLLDTNAWIALFKGDPQLTRRVAELGLEELVLCAPVWSELWFGACKSAKVASNQQHLREFFLSMPVTPFDERAAERCGEIRADLARRGLPIGPFDAQIAAIALASRLVVVTRNVSEFSRVEGLAVENWQDGA